MKTQRTPVSSTLALFCLVLALLAAACADTKEPAEPAEPTEPAETTDTADGGSCADQPYVVNPDAAQDVIESPTNFLRCTAGDYALCYYSGADPLPCTVAEASQSAACQCQVFTASEEEPMYVLMTSILNLCAFTEAVEQCGEDGSGCYNICNDDPHSPQCHGVTLPEDQQQAAVCDYVADGTFNPTADFISTFSFAKVAAPDTEETFAIACNDTTGPYAGCMTAPCNGEATDELGHRYVTCACPVWPADGSAVDYQFGRKCDETPTGNCTLADGQVWSAAYSPAGCG
jgi:hypothetical protein